MDQQKILIKFEKDTDTSSNTYGEYWLRLYKNGKNIDNEPFTEREVIQTKKQTKNLKAIVQMEGISGHIPLHDWLKEKHPGFFERSITDLDSDKIVIEILKALQEFYNNENIQ